MLSRLGILLGLPIVGAVVVPLATPQHNATSTLVVYPIPTGMAINDSFNVSITSGNNEWSSLGTYLIKLNLINSTTGSSMIQESSLAYFDADGPIEVKAVYNRAPVTSARVRPESLGVKPIIDGNTVSFTLVEPRGVILEVNDLIFDCLHLMANPIDRHPPRANSTNTIYFGPGLHKVAGGSLNVSSGQTVYVAGGAVLQSAVHFINASNASIRGSGILTGGTVTIQYSSNIKVSGLTMLNTNVASLVSSGVTIEGIHSFSSVGWGDGMDFYCSKNVLVKRVFMRNSDDCFAIYNHRDQWYGNSTNITLQDSALWADVAHPINIGTHGNSIDPETIDGVYIKNIDVMDHREPQMDYQGTLAINAGDGNLVQNVVVEDFRVEDFREGQLINFRVMFNEKYNTSPGRGIQNVTIKNMSYNGTHANPAIFVGYDADRPISFVQFQNLTINGVAISDTMKKPTWYMTTDMIPMFANEHVNNLTFI